MGHLVCRLRGERKTVNIPSGSKSETGGASCLRDHRPYRKVRVIESERREIYSVTRPSGHDVRDGAAWVLSYTQDKVK